MNEVPNQNYSSKSELTTRVKVRAWKQTVGITLPRNLVERARNQGLNISRIAEQALSSVLDYIAQQKANETSISFLGEASFPKEGSGPVDQSGMIAAFARRKPRVQIPPGPLRARRLRTTNQPKQQVLDPFNNGFSFLLPHESKYILVLWIAQ